MRLWVESAYQTIAGSAIEASGGFIGTLTTESVFAALVAGGVHQDPNARSPFGDVLTSLANGTPPDTVAEAVLATLPRNAHLPFAMLQVRDGSQASLVECDAPPLFMARRGRLVLLPVIEEEVQGHLIRRCDFELRDGDHLALVSEGYIRAIGGKRRALAGILDFGWRDVAVSIRRLTETRCDAEQLAGALTRIADRRIGESAIPDLPYPISVLALFVRPMRTASVWSGPPVQRSAEPEILARLLTEEDVRIICGDTTAEIAARLLEARLVMEPRPEEGWGEVPPVSRMVRRDGTEPVALVTEGLVTMRVARERLMAAQRPRDLAGRADGASRLARLLLEADRITFLVGLAVNPAQAERDGMPLRKAAVEALAQALRARGKIVVVEYF